MLFDVIMPVEQWRPVPGYEGLYSVSYFGRIRSEPRTVDRSSGRPLPLRGRLLHIALGSNGYLQVTLSQNNVGATVYVHQAVLAAFVGPQQPGMVTRHLNGVRTDNRLVNLAYGTYSENSLDMRRHGNCHNTNKTHCPSGHEYTPENTYMWKNARYCKTCRAGKRTTPAWRGKTK
jgi:hypothetical protein